MFIKRYYYHIVILRMRIRAHQASSSGFTLIEVLIVIGLIAILAAVVLIAVNPARQFAQARNSQRTANINAILNAIGQNVADNKGVFLCGSGWSGASTSIDSGAGGTGKDFSCLIPTYLSQLPVDPTAPTGVATGYFVSTDTASRFIVCAPNAAEPAIPGSGPICVKR